MFCQPCLLVKEFSRDFVPSLWQNLSLSTFKILIMLWNRYRVLDSWYYVEKYQRKRVACYCCQKLRQNNFFKKNFGKCSQIGCFKVRNSTRKTLTLGQSPSNDILQDKSFTGEIAWSLAHQSPRGNMRKLFDCIRTPLRRF